jgi:hypothetical protein
VLKANDTAGMVRPPTTRQAVEKHKNNNAHPLRRRRPTTTARIDTIRPDKPTNRSQ